MKQASPVPVERVGGLYMEPHELETVRRILRACVPDRKVWAFESRATGVRLKRFSDLDLAIAGRLTLVEQARLAEDFDESALPFKVDIVALDELEGEFAKRIAEDFVAVQLAASMTPL